MTYENFVYWLQGYFEISKPKALDAFKVQVVKDHLKILSKYTSIQLMITPEIAFGSWLNLFLNEKTTCTANQTDEIRSKLSDVFIKVTPNYLDSDKATFEQIMTGRVKEWPYGGQGEGFAYPLATGTC